MNYKNFSYYYDSLIEPQYYDDYYKFIMKYTEGDRILELGCGTGEVAIRLVENGKRVLATDLSEDMLNIAREKAMERCLKLDVALVDMTDFEVNSVVDTVLILTDAINYITDIDPLDKVFYNVSHALKEGGTLIFDINSAYKCNVTLKDYHEVMDDEDFHFVWDVESDLNGSIVHHVVIDDLMNDEHIDETHYQITFSLDEYDRLLEKYGFNVSHYSDFEEYHDECQRVIFVCKKE